MISNSKQILLAVALTVIASQGNEVQAKRYKGKVNQTAAKSFRKTLKSDHFINAQYSKHSLISRFSSWGINPQYKAASINLEKTWKKFQKNKDVTVAVVDTGIQYNHPFLRKNIIVKSGKTTPANFGKDFSFKMKNNRPADTHGHGTHVSGIVKSIFPEVKLLALKYYNPKASGQANLDSTIKCLEYAVDQGVDIINYSGGGPEPSIEELRVLKKAERKGILIIAAAGNERSNIDLRKNAYYPASYGLSNIITVGAHDQSVRLIPSSNWGKYSVDIAAPGHRIRSAIPGSSAGYMTGTSQATAFVTGTAALLKARYPQLAYDQIKNIILSSSIRMKSLVGKVLGAGKLDALRAMNLAESIMSKKIGDRARQVAKKR
ncbi:MAG: thermitase [Thermoproteota archaeon]|jgi:thermitase